MRILLLGGSGHVGWELQRSLAPLGEVLAPRRAELDLLDQTALREAVRSLRPGVIVNAAAYTDVDRAESEPDLARTLNALVPAALAKEARPLGATLIHYSTDFVFDGSKGQPYQEHDTPHPLNVYGKTKLEGEQAIDSLGGLFVVLRTGWVYSLRRPCFVTRVLEWARRQATLRIAVDQVGSPTWSRPLAQATAGLLARVAAEGVDWLGQHAGLYHLTCRGAVNRHEFALAILSLDPRKSEQIVQDVQPAARAEFDTPAARPDYSALDSGRFAQAFGVQLPEWQDALRLALTPGPSGPAGAETGPGSALAGPT
jgi:dTDP-4-dehydrorhamnose reductase